MLIQRKLSTNRVALSRTLNTAIQIHCIFSYVNNDVITIIDLHEYILHVERICNPIFSHG